MTITHRPTFDFVVALTPEDALNTLRAAVSATELPLKAAHLSGQCELQITEERRHVWSPHMSVIFTPAEGGTRVSGHVGPNLPIWSLFLTAYGALGIFVMAGLTFGYSQWSIHQKPYGFLVAGLCVVMLFVVYGIGKVGEGLAEAQTQLMHTFLQETLNVTHT